MLTNSNGFLLVDKDNLRGIYKEDIKHFGKRKFILNVQIK